MRILAETARGPGLPFITAAATPARELVILRRALAETIARPGATGSVEYRLRHRDGSWRVISTIGRNMVDDAAVILVVAVFSSG